MDSQILGCFGWFRVAVQALVLVAETDGTCSSTAMAQELQAHATFLRRVTARLVHARILVAREGRAGGYRLARPAESITLAEVYQSAKSAYQPDKAAACTSGMYRYPCSIWLSSARARPARLRWPIPPCSPGAPRRSATRDSGWPSTITCPS
ncbi:MAG TPA: Rrf2 family transcriptional regulator [Roseiflexaceae bacterium]|nr:Rrf2 family transcriptional regulator [Roseiflexaceae bacterium]